MSGTFVSYIVFNFKLLGNSSKEILLVLRLQSFFRPSGDSRIPTYLLILSGHKICMSLELSE